MNNWKIAEIVLLAVSYLLAAAKSVMSFIDYVDKLKKEPEECFQKNL